MRMAMSVGVPGSVDRRCGSMQKNVSPIARAVRRIRWIPHHGEKIGCQ
jgi:hypothetical protein